ncbi:MAG: NAD(P)/FAD-dependent oxidoreductase [bacterium]
MSERLQRLRVNGIVRDLAENESVLRQRAASKLGVRAEDLVSVELVKRSLDARKRPQFVCNVDVVLRTPLKKLPSDTFETPDPETLAPRVFHPRRQERVVVIGAGPAGLFCAHRLAAAGLKPVLIDRGEPVEVRGRHVSALMHKGELREDSNICFGEGGAGTWSDGKLYTRVNDPRVRHVLETIVELGGPEDILVEGKPHLGTDRLVALCKSFRARLIAEGCEVRFGAFVSDFRILKGAEDRVTGVVLRDGEVVDCDRVVMAVGHSAREMYRWMAGRNVAMVQKPFAVGFRVEHEQQLINDIQYGKWSKTDGLPTADYRVAANFGEGKSRKGVYSFCMCPGGQVVPSPTVPGRICVNGMSHASRKGHWANSALVVTVEPTDFGKFGPIDFLGDYDGILDGMAFQLEAERRAYELGGGGFIAPAQRVPDFLAGRASTEVRKSTYKPGVAPADLTTCYPEFVIDLLKAGIKRFERTMPGFVSESALLIGVETRTSAPIQVDRDKDTLRSASIANLYPAGEGAGYGGGIVSAAIDGLRVAETILAELE